MNRILHIDRFLGLNKKWSPTDLQNHEAQTLSGFETAARPGALVKRKGQTKIYGTTGITGTPLLRNGFQFRVNRPTSKEMFLLHVDNTDGAIAGVTKELWVRPYYSAGWNDSWQNLLEQEEELSITSTASTTEFVCSGLSSSTNSYYVGWYVFNFTRGLGSLITAYVGSTKTATLKTAITAMAGSDVISLYRFPLITQFEGSYTADTSTSTSQIYDAESFTAAGDHFELRADFDAAYDAGLYTDGWTVKNVTRSETDTVASYEAYSAGNKRIITLDGTIASQASGDTYQLYKTKREFLVDNKMRFRQRPEALIVSCGNSAGRYPRQYPLWYGYIAKTYFFGSTSNQISSAFYLEPNILDAPDDSILSSTSKTANADGLTGTFHVAMAYRYDGYQLGALTTGGKAEDNKQTCADEKMTVNLEIGYSARPNMRHSRVLNKRVTSVAIFASNDYVIATGEGAWYWVAEVPIREDFDIGFTRARANPRAQISEKPPRRRGGTSNAEGRRVRKGQTSQAFSWSGTDPYTIAVDIFNSTWENRGLTYSEESGGVGGDRVNYQLSEEGLNTTLVSGLFLDNETQESMIAFSAWKLDNTPSPDYFPVVSNNIELAKFGIRLIRNMVIVGQKAFIFGWEKTIKLEINSGFSQTWNIERDFGFLGSPSNDSVVKVGNKVYALLNNGFYEIDFEARLLSLAIENNDSPPFGSTVDMSTCVIGYNPATDEILLCFGATTGNATSFVLSLRDGQWRQDTNASLAYPYPYYALFNGLDSNRTKLVLYGIHQQVSAGTPLTGLEGIYQISSGTSDSTESGGAYIKPNYKSKVYRFGSPDSMVTLGELNVTYKSDTAFQIDVYINRSASAMTWNAASDNQPAAKTTEGSFRLQFPAGTRCWEIEIEFSIPTALQATNTYLEITELELFSPDEPRKRLD